MLGWATIPRDQLTIDATTDDNLGVFGGELNWRDFNVSLKCELSENNLTVREVKNENLGLERFAADFSSIIKG